MEKLSLIDEILAKLPSQWTEEEWAEVKDALCKGYLKVSSRAFSMDGVPSEAVTKLLEPFIDWPTTPKAWAPTEIIDQLNRQPCAIEAFFKAHPNERSVMMVCSCPRCTVYC